MQDQQVRSGLDVFVAMICVVAIVGTLWMPVMRLVVRRRGVQESTAPEYRGQGIVTAIWSPYVGIEEFYRQDDRRRMGREVVFGDRWLDEEGTPWRLAWAPSTGELYEMRRPPSRLYWLPGGPEYRMVRNADLLTRVLARGARLEIQDRLSGWEAVVGTGHSLRWAYDRLGRQSDT